MIALLFGLLSGCGPAASSNSVHSIQRTKDGKHYHLIYSFAKYKSGERLPGVVVIHALNDAGDNATDLRIRYTATGEFQIVWVANQQEKVIQRNGAGRVFYVQNGRCERFKFSPSWSLEAIDKVGDENYLNQLLEGVPQAK
jgi:hypothetical protein